MKPNLILPQLFARFEKFLIISHKKAQRTFQSQAGKKNYKIIKKLKIKKFLHPRTDAD